MRVDQEAALRILRTLREQIAIGALLEDGASTPLENQPIDAVSRTLATSVPRETVVDWWLFDSELEE